MKKLIAVGMLSLAIASQAFAEPDYQALGEAAQYTAQGVESLINTVEGGARPTPTPGPRPTPGPVPTPSPDSGWPFVLENDAEVVKHLTLAGQRLREGGNAAFAAARARLSGDVRTMVEQGAFACGAVNRAWSMLSVANAKAFDPEPFGGISRYRPFEGQIRSYAEDTDIAYQTHCK